MLAGLFRGWRRNALPRLIAVIPAGSKTGLISSRTFDRTRSAASLCSLDHVAGRAASSKHGLPVIQEVVERQTDILDDLTQNHGRHVSAGMVRNGGAASIGMPVLHVRATLPGQDKTQGIEDATHLTGLEDRRPRHGLCGNDDTLRADELRVQIWLPVLQQHLDDLTEIAL